MEETKRLGKAEILAALALGAAARKGSPDRELAPWLGLGLDGGEWRGAAESLELFPAWLAEVGVLACGERRYLLYANPRPGLDGYFPSTFALRLGAGRYSVETWDCGLRSRTGLEIASAPPLVFSPPCSGHAMIALIESLRDSV